MTDQKHPARDGPERRLERPSGTDASSPGQATEPRDARRPSADDFDRHLAAALAAAAPGGDGACPDASTLAAWIDGTLAENEREACERHLGSCLRCQAVLLAIDGAASAEAPAVAARLPSRASRPGSVPARARPADAVGSRSWRHLRWAAPLGLAAAAVLAVWVARSPSPQRFDDEDIPTVAKSAVPESRPAETPSPKGPATGGAAPAQPATPHARDAEQRPTRTLEPGRERASAESAVPVVPVPPASPQASMQVAREAGTPSLQEPLPRADRVQVRARPEAASVAADVAAKAPADVRAGEPEAAAGTAPVAPGAERLAAGRAIAANERQGSTIRVTAPSGLVSWVVTPTGDILRVAEGAPPEQVASTGSRILAGTASSDRTVWVVGRAGAVWRTTDGTVWVRSSPPANADLVAVASDRPDAATVTASDGRRFATADGGRTWRLETP